MSEVVRAQQFPPAIQLEGIRGAALGLSNQPDTRSLLRENLGVADVATRAIANRVASIEPLVKVTRTVEAGTTRDETLDDHPLKALLDRPNPTFSRTQLMRLTAQYLVTVGDAAWIKVGSQLGTTVELHPLPPHFYEPIVSRGVIEGYRITDAAGRKDDIPATDVVRFFFPDPENPYKGEGYLGPNAIVTDAQKFANQQLRAHYENDAMPPAVLEPASDAAAPSPTEWKAFLREWAQNHHARSGEFKGLPSRLPNGWSITELMRHSGAETEPLLRFWLEEQLMNFGTPQSVLGRVVSGDRSSAETNQYVFDRHTILPIIILIADALTLQLAPDFDPSLFVQFEEFVSADKAYELDREKQDLQLKVRSINQVREDRNLDPVDWGEKPVGTLADSVFDPNEGMEPEADDPEALRGNTLTEERSQRVGFFSPEAAWARLLHVEQKFTRKAERTLRGIIEAQRKETLRRLDALTPRSRATPGDLFDPDEWQRMFRDRITPLLRAVFEVVGGESLTALRPDADFLFNDEVVERLRREAERLATRTGDTTLSRITATLTDAQENGESTSQMASRINRVFGVRRRDARTIARTEVLKANQAAQVESFRQSGVVERKQWNTSRDDAVRDSHEIDGQVVALDSQFTLDDGSRAASPGDPDLSAENIINCRCFVTPVLEG